MKAKVILLAWLAGEAAVYTAALYWLVSISLRLDIVLAGLLTSVLYVRRIVEHNKSLFDINDAEVVRVSALANRLEGKVLDLEGKLDEAIRQIEDTIAKTIGSGHHWDERMANYVGTRLYDAESQIARLQADVKRAGLASE
jgi:hypothetical protein